MRTQFRFNRLIELFNESLAASEPACGGDKVCLEIVRAERSEQLTFGRLNKSARKFALWLAQAAGLGIGDKVAILGKNRADWDVAFWGAVLAGAVPVLIDPERPVEGVIEHLIHTDTDLNAIKSRTNHSEADLVKKPDLLKSLVWQSISKCQQKSKYLSSHEKISSAGLKIRIEEFQKTSTGKIKRQKYIPG